MLHKFTSSDGKAFQTLTTVSVKNVNVSETVECCTLLPPKVWTCTYTSSICV